MKVSYNYGNRSRKNIVILMAILYVAITIAQPILNRRGVAIVGNGILISGILGALQFGVALLMVAVEYEVGGRLAMIIVIFSTFTATIPLIITHNFSSISGICYYLVCIVAVWVLRKRIALERKNAQIDELTGISNRRNTAQYIDYLITKNTPFYLLFLDLDNFKLVNDTQGHEKGDRLLKELVNQWNTIDYENSFLGRFGGDEFLVVIKADKCTDPLAHANRYIDVVRKMASIDESLYSYLAMSVGITEFPKDSKRSGDLIRKADITVHKAQQQGRNISLMYDVSFEESVVREQYIEDRIRKALDNELFYMVYQPQYKANSHKLRGFESLIRMKSNNEMPLCPGDFIPVAEKTDLIIDIGEYVLKKVTSDFARLIAVNPDLILSVNISAKQMMSRDFVSVVKKALEDSKFNPKNLEIEITEYCLMDTTDEAVRIIEEIKSLGIMIAMDDFGTGYSSLSYLNRLPIDLIKIDKSIVDDMGQGEIIGAICSMGHALSCEIIAEGVEEEEQLEILREKGCDLIQGFIWGRPVPFDDAAALV